ncbi:mucin-2-like isoform X3 [Monodelphis domestica]|uniref:mucin-2-like isoform X3 n=1 Tax=Monodelphis domestica TaxID=13616 RepID=UPI0024E1F11B|nr:mucin-2-like isoform X3 [Monodelphis domestica]
MPNYKEGTKMQKEPLFEEKLIISAIPYKRQGFVPSLLKGEPKMLGVLQILMGLIIASFGGFLFFSFIEVKSTNSKTPILYITAYPLWAGACYTMSGFITILNTLYPPRQNHQLLFLDSLCILVAASGIALLLYSFYEDAFFHCDNLSNGICTIGKSFLHGIFSLLLILTLVQLSIAATLLAFECQGIRKDTAKEVLYFKPSEVKEPKQTKNMENQLQFHIMKSPADKNEENTLASLIGGYTFFKLRPSGQPYKTQLEPLLPPPSTLSLPPSKLQELTRSSVSFGKIPHPYEASTSECFKVSYFSSSISSDSMRTSISLPSFTSKYIQISSLPPICLQRSTSAIGSLETTGVNKSTQFPSFSGPSKPTEDKEILPASSPSSISACQEVPPATELAEKSTSVQFLSFEGMMALKKRADIPSSSSSPSSVSEFTIEATVSRVPRSPRESTDITEIPDSSQSPPSLGSLARRRISIQFPFFSALDTPTKVKASPPTLSRISSKSEFQEVPSSGLSSNESMEVPSSGLLERCKCVQFPSISGTLVTRKSKEVPTSSSSTSSTSESMRGQPSSSVKAMSKAVQFPSLGSQSAPRELKEVISSSPSSSSTTESTEAPPSSSPLTKSTSVQFPSFSGIIAQNEMQETPPPMSSSPSSTNESTDGQPSHLQVKRRSLRSPPIPVTNATTEVTQPQPFSSTLHSTNESMEAPYSDQMDTSISKQILSISATSVTTEIKEVPPSFGTNSANELTKTPFLGEVVTIKSLQFPSSASSLAIEDREISPSSPSSNQSMEVFPPSGPFISSKSIQLCISNASIPIVIPFSSSRLCSKNLPMAVPTSSDNLELGKSSFPGITATTDAPSLPCPDSVSEFPLSDGPNAEGKSMQILSFSNLSSSLECIKHSSFSEVIPQSKTKQASLFQPNSPSQTIAGVPSPESTPGDKCVEFTLDASSQEFSNSTLLVSGLLKEPIQVSSLSDKSPQRKTVSNRFNIVLVSKATQFSVFSDRNSTVDTEVMSFPGPFLPRESMQVADFSGTRSSQEIIQVHSNYHAMSVSKSTQVPIFSDLSSSTEYPEELQSVSISSKENTHFSDKSSKEEVLHISSGGHRSSVSKSTQVPTFSDTRPSMVVTEEVMSYPFPYGESMQVPDSSDTRPTQESVQTSSAEHAISVNKSTQVPIFSDKSISATSIEEIPSIPVPVSSTESIQGPDSASTSIHPDALQVPSGIHTVSVQFHQENLYKFLK